MLHVIFGEDEFRASEALRALKAAIDTDGSLATNTSVLAARGLTPQTLIQNAAAIPFLSPSRLVVVEGLLTTLGSRRGVVEAWQQLVDFVPLMPTPTTWCCWSHRRSETTAGAAWADRRCSPRCAGSRTSPSPS